MQSNLAQEITSPSNVVLSSRRMRAKPHELIDACEFFYLSLKTRTPEGCGKFVRCCSCRLGIPVVCGQREEVAVEPHGQTSRVRSHRSSYPKPPLCLPGSEA